MARFDLRAYVDDKLGVRTLVSGRSGEELVCHCPFCEGREKFYVNPRKGKFICYKCGERGDAVRLVEQVDGLPRADALRFVIEESVRLPSRPASALSAAVEEEPEEEARELRLPGNFVPVFDGAAWRVPEYLRARRIRARTAAAYGVGACYRGCGGSCRDRDPGRRLCEPCRYAGRVVVPARVGGRLAFYQGRSVTGALPKYLAPAVDRSGVLLGYDEALGAGRVLVVEGPFDVLGAAQAGFPAVALLGKACSVRQAALLAAGGFSRATVLLDPEATREAAAVAAVLGDVMDADLALLPDGLDPGDAPREVIAAAVAASRPATLRDRILGKT